MRKLLLGLVVLPVMASSVLIGCTQTNTVEPPATTTATTTTNTPALNESVLRADHPQTYTVVKGDTLWGIAQRFLNQPWRWKDIWHMNPTIKNPHLIYPGDNIKLVYVDGKPMLTVDRGANSSASGDAQDCTNAPTQKTMPDGVVKLSPKCRASSLEDAIPAIPLESIGPFLSENRVVNSSEQIVSAPHIVASERVTGGQGDIMFARGQFDANTPVYDIYRVGKTYNNPVTNEELGLVIRSIGQAKVFPTGDDVTKIELTRTVQEVLAEDKLIPAEETKLSSYFLPQAPEKPINGYILDVLGGVANLGQYDIVLLSIGERDGLKVGTVLAVHNEAGVVVDPATHQNIKLPAEKSGLLMVFRTFEKMSYGLVLQSDRPLAVMDQVKNP